MTRRCRIRRTGRSYAATAGSPGRLLVRGSCVASHDGREFGSRSFLEVVFHLFKMARALSHLSSVFDVWFLYCMPGLSSFIHVYSKCENQLLKNIGVGTYFDVSLLPKTVGICQKRPSSKKEE